MMNKQIKRGDVFLADLGSGNGSEQGGLRPVCVIQNNVGNTYSPTIIVAAITSNTNKKLQPTHIHLSQEQYNSPKACVILAEQVRTIDKNRLKGERLFSLNDMDTVRLDRAVAISFGLVAPKQERSYIQERVAM